MHCNNSDSKICWQIDLRNCRFTCCIAYKYKVTFLEFHHHIAEYLMIKCCRNVIIAQLRHCDCIGRQRHYWSRMIKAGCLSTMNSIIMIHLIIMFTLTLLMLSYTKIMKTGVLLSPTYCNNIHHFEYCTI